MIILTLSEQHDGRILSAFRTDLPVWRGSGDIRQRYDGREKDWVFDLLPSAASAYVFYALVSAPISEAERGPYAAMLTWQMRRGELTPPPVLLPTSVTQVVFQQGLLDL